MTTSPEPPVKADPGRPYKAIVAALIPALFAFVTYLVDQNNNIFPPWVLLLLAGLAAGLGTFLTRNPLVTNTGGRV